ncbi:ATP-binding protein [Allomesorhizobium camelthorni]|uniref:histidine kinase n=1 Tax=Allomesorhizobium camelthorni TaxID=475069 RepID=A0A6G4WIX5_9HYPH|nr:ATP-binding protein [Mesorhizobium camelthorni]NGO54752.1 PAS domain S-box protein [Mesorhizobium camelthorni]
MPSEAYSFIDVVVLDEVRERFAAGDALAILSIDLEQVIWANGPGAALFGHDDIEAIIGEPSRLGLPARRQIMAIRGYPDIGRDRPLMVRMTTGVSSQAVAFIASALTLPDGEKAILLAAPIAQAASRGPAEAAERAIAGFNEPGHFVAFIDGRGEVEAASAGFGELGVSRETLAALAAEIGGGPERIARRVIRGGSARLPAGMARLTDEPARHLLVVIDERRAGGEEFTPGEGADAAELTAHEQEPEPATSADAVEQDNSAARHAAVETAAPPAADEKSTPAIHEKTAGEAPPAQLDNWYFSAAGEPPHDQPPSQAVEGPERRKTEAPAAAERVTTPMRFVWRTDAEGRFSAISPEFADAVGALAADVVGRRFKDVAATFALDPSGEITGLLDRRDTWSGRSVLWPVAGTALKIPVDLAALPVYGRDRDFQGFRGFGVARGAEAVADPEGIGLVLVAPRADVTAPQSGETPAETAQPEAGQSKPDAADPFKGEVPVLTIVPKPDRRFADKVIRLAEHRQPAPEKGGLSSIERSAFREIGERLRLIGEPAAPGQADTAAAAEQEASPAPKADEGAAADAAGKEQPPSLEDKTSAVETGARDETSEAATTERSQTTIPSEDQAATEPVAAVEIEEAAEATAEEIAEAEEPEAVEAEAEAETADADAAEPTETAEAKPDAEEEADAAEPAELSDATESGAALPDEAVEHIESPEAAEAEARKKLPADTGILAKLPVPVLIHSGDALHYANDEFLALTGYDSVEQLAEAGGLDVLFSDPYGDDQHDEADRSLRLSTRDGLEFPIEALLRSVPWSGGKALMLVVRRTGEDETPAEPVPLRSAEEQELRARVAEMRTIIDTATDGVVLIANDGAIRSISRPAEALFSFDSDEVAGKPFISLFAIESQRAARDYLNGLSDHGVASVLNDGREVIGREAQGRFIPLFMTIGKLPNDSGYCAVVRDITQWKRAEEELTQARALAERASSQKTDFLARVSHEIRTPLNAIIGFSELMVDERFGPIANDRYRDYLRDINRSGNHVLDLVNDLLDISKIEAGQQEMAYEAVSLNDTLAETVAMMQPQANRERVIIRSSFASKLPEVVADLRSIRQIALNILSNAVRYTQAGGQVIISTAYEPSGDIVMRVRDTGVGMSQAEIEQALKPFKQINSLKRTRGDGTGLGLPLTKAMVEANRARFSINSTPGEGTLVEITFPSTRVLAD